MKATASTTIKANKSDVWDTVTDIEKAKDRIECIKDITVLENPGSGLVGLKWKETREMFGKEAVETMWITEAKTNEYYITEARNCGCVYHSKVELKGQDGNVELVMTFQSKPESFFAKLMTPMMFFMKGMVQKAFIKDLEDIKRHLEK